MMKESRITMKKVGDDERLNHNLQKSPKKITCSTSNRYINFDDDESMKIDRINLVMMIAMMIQ